MTSYPLPKDTVDAFKQYQGQVQNAGLVFDRFAPDLSKTNDKEAKKKALEKVADLANQKADKNLLSAWRERWQLAAKAACVPQTFTLKTDWRLIAGLGRKGPLEVGFTFNRYGFPVIPGSSLKGLARAWGFFLIVEKLSEKLTLRAELWPQLEKALQGDWDNNNEWREWVRQCVIQIKQPELWQALERALQMPGDEGKKQQRAKLDTLLKAVGGDKPAQWRRVFGTQDEAGQAVFFEAIPASRPTLELDIMNPHYPDYYADNAPPTNWQSPIPVYFLTVAPHTEFCFAVGWRGAKADESLRQVAEDWLKAGLIELGAGSKTSAGYGYFQPETKIAEIQEKIILTQQEESVSEPFKPGQPTLSQRGTIVEIRPDKRFGRVRDDETGQVYWFSTSVIEGNTPAKKAKVIFELQGNQVLKVRR